jgi:hypothetical protein
MNTLLIIIVISLIFILLACDRKEHLVDGAPQCSDQSSSEDQLAQLGETAKDACNKISSEAEKIKAHYGGIENVVKSLPGLNLFNPAAYKSGDTSSEDMMRNIVNTNLSECDVTKIESDCKNTVSSVQSNIIDNSQCPACSDPEILKIYPNICSVSGVKQTNKANISQSCTLQSAIQSLRQKTNSVDAQALANVMQEANGLLTGRGEHKSENCNVVDTDMSSRSYMETKASCANNLAVDQKNHLGVCGQVTDVIQKNNFESMQSCVIENTVSKEAVLDAESKMKQQTDIKQSSIGVTTTALIAAVIGLVIFAIVAGIVLVYFGKASIEAQANMNPTAVAAKSVMGR